MKVQAGSANKVSPPQDDDQFDSLHTSTPAEQAANELWCGSVTSDWLFIQKWTFNEFRRYVDGLTKSGVKLEAADRRLN